MEDLGKHIRSEPTKQPTLYIISKEVVMVILLLSVIYIDGNAFWAKL